MFGEQTFAQLRMGFIVSNQPCQLAWKCWRSTNIAICMLHLLVLPILIQVLLWLRIWAPLSTAVLNILYQWGANIAGSWHIWRSSHTGYLCLWRHWHGLLGTKWQHSWLVLQQLSNIDCRQTGWEIKCKTVVCPFFLFKKKSVCNCYSLRPGEILVSQNVYQNLSLFFYGHRSLLMRMHAEWVTSVVHLIPRTRHH